MWPNYGIIVWEQGVVMETNSTAKWGEGGGRKGGVGHNEREGGGRGELGIGEGVGGR